MTILRFFLKSVAYTITKLCRQNRLLAGLALLCLFLPGVLGFAVQQSLSSGVDFLGITLAVTAPAEEPSLALIQRFLGNMRDIRRYCTFEVMENAQAMDALEQGTVTAVLELPEGFLSGVLSGSNPDVNLIVDETRPLEALLTQWVGQCAVDLLCAVQEGIYATLEVYDTVPSPSLSRSDVVTSINLRYVNQVLNRQDLFSVQTIGATGVLPTALHYGLSLLAWLAFSLAPLFFQVYTPERLTARHRLAVVGQSSAVCCAADLTACTGILLPLLWLPLCILLAGRVLAAFVCALVFSLLAGLYGSLCCLLTGSAARCGSLSFLLSLAALVLAGGVIPPVLLPQTLRALAWLSPISWLRQTAAHFLEYETPPIYPVLLLAGALAMLAGIFPLYRKRMTEQEVRL